MDSMRWNEFHFRDDDIVITARSKSGTTWTPQIVTQMIFDGSDTAFGQAVSPWIDFQLMPHAPTMAESQTHRRFMKTYLPIDALVFSPTAKYIHVGGDARDVAWSFHHHMIHNAPVAAERFGEVARRIGAASRPLVPPEVRDFYRIWRENDPKSETSFWRNVHGRWDARELPNVLLVHYANLKTDLLEEFRRIAGFLDTLIDEAKFPLMLQHYSIDHMKERGARVEFLETMFEGGGRNFVHKGTNGRWRDVLTPAEIARRDEVAAKYLTPDCAHCLKTGEMPA